MCGKEEDFVGRHCIEKIPEIPTIIPLHGILFHGSMQVNDSIGSDILEKKGKMQNFHCHLSFSFSSFFFE